MASWPMTKWSMTNWSVFQTPRVLRRNLPIKVVVLPWEGIVVDTSHVSQVESLRRALGQQGLHLNCSQVGSLTSNNCSRFMRNLQQQPTLLTNMLANGADKRRQPYVPLLTTDFVANQLVRIRSYCEVEISTVETVDLIRSTLGIDVITGSDLDGEVLEAIQTETSIQGYQPPTPKLYDITDSSHTWSEVDTQDINPNQVLVVSDNTPTIKNSKHNGYWTVGVSGHDIGLDQITNGTEGLSYNTTTHQLRQAGADFTLPDLYGLPDIIYEIESSAS